MKFTQYKKDGKKEGRNDDGVTSCSRSPKAKLMTVATVAAAMLCATPLIEKRAHALDLPQPQAPVAVAPEETGVENLERLQAEAENGPLKSEKAQEDPKKATDAKTVSVTVPAVEEPQSEPIAPAKPDYSDHGLGSIERVDMTGKARPINLDHKWSAGGNVVSNEAGSAIYGSIAFGINHNNQFKFDGGNVWFGELSVPFATLSVKQKVELWRLTGLYYGRVTVAGYLPSYLYSSHAVGLGFSQPLSDDEKWRLRLGAVAVGAFSYPLGDDTYFNIAGGASVEYNKRVLAYAAPNFYFAADTPQKTAYIGYYKPQFESLATGAQVRFNEYSVGPFANFGVIKSSYGVRASRSMRFGDWATGDIFGSMGVTHWNPEISGRNDFLAVAGLRLIIAGRYMNTTITSQYEHTQAGGVPEHTMDIPTEHSPGPYGYGRSGDAYWDGQVDLAKGRMLGSKSLEEFKASYAGASAEDTINAGRFLLAFMAQVAYAHGAQSALMTGNFLNSSVVEVASVDSNELFGLLQQYISFYNTHNPSDPLPANLANGVALCTGAHEFVAEFFRSNGLHTIVTTVNTAKGMHAVDIVSSPGQTVLLSWGDRISAPSDSYDGLLRLYGQIEHAPTFESQVFGAASGPSKYIGTYVTPEGDLWHGAVGIPGPWLLNGFLGVR
jgi:hypothetical protein